MILEHDAMFISVLSTLMKRVNFCCPLAELGSLNRFHSISNRNDDIQIIQSNWFIRISKMQFLHIAFFDQFAFFEYIGQVSGNH